MAKKETTFRTPPAPELLSEFGLVCVEILSSALNMQFPAFAAERRRPLHGARSAPAVIGRYFLPTERSAANTPATVAAWCRSVGRTDGRTPDRYISTLFRIVWGQRYISLYISLCPFV